MPVRERPTCGQVRLVRTEDEAFPGLPPTQSDRVEERGQSRDSPRSGSAGRLPTRFCGLTWHPGRPRLARKTELHSSDHRFRSMKALQYLPGGGRG